MRKTFVWAMMAALLVAGSAFAAAPNRVVSNATFTGGGPTTTNNDDSCDIGVAPAATLLLPYFEVDIDSAAGTGENTLFTITNVSNLPQVAHVTLWTDWSFPVIDFNIYLTGYDVQSISLFDVISRGQIAPTKGTGSDVSPVGALSGTSKTADFNNPLVNEASCVSLPVQLPQVYITRMQSAFTEGAVPSIGTLPGCDEIGGVHDNAVGYATVDVAAGCFTGLPTDPDYFATEILFDNVLIGDYQQIDGDNDFAQGNPMVHIRAIPEGGAAGSQIATNLPRTFYSRYQTTSILGDTFDRRQPLPALFAARYITGGGSGFLTGFKIWREGVTTDADTSCGDFIDNSELGVTEFVRFDEAENPTTLAPDIVVSPPIGFAPVLPETSLTDSESDTFPPNSFGGVGGWIYMNLDHTAGDGYVSQNWVINSMRAEGRYSVDFDAAWLGNGCTGEIGQSLATNGTDPIGPAPNFTVYPFQP